MIPCEFCGQENLGYACKDYVGCAKRMLDAMRTPGWNIFKAAKPKPTLTLIRGGLSADVD